MSNNTTLSDGRVNISFYILYVCQGLVIGGSNLVIALCILRYEALRTCKEFIVMLGLCLADALNMSAFLMAGLYRINLVLTGTHTVLLTSSECALKPQNFIFPISFLQANFMLCIISIDRLLSVIDPLKYLGYTSGYALCLLFTSFGYGLLNEIGYLIVAYDGRNNPPYIQATCITSQAVKNGPEWFKFHYSKAPTFYAFLSVILYGVVILKAKEKIVPLDDRNAQEKLCRQRRITKTLGWSCFCTVMLFCIPNVIGNTILKNGYPSVSFLFYIMSTLNPLCNVFLYQIRHKELRQALKGLFKCKMMPTDVKMWKEVTTKVRSQNQS